MSDRTPSVATVAIEFKRSELDLLWTSLVNERDRLRGIQEELSEMGARTSPQLLPRRQALQLMIERVYVLVSLEESGHEPT